ncbi:hypothetical protein EUX98_g8189 [Antrodiella citrinella]|uniref:Cytochrome P450 n=1 Tax=Antrodiella citrinella TaxID=2447956 RepID=A0A4S4MB95_9APHY|nr:hypothetical protein EUX98_g8189 [Antrodiella citrinella]
MNPHGFTSVAYLPSFLPGMGFKHTAAEWEHSAIANAAEGFEMVKTALRNGTARPSLLQKALEAKDGTYEDIVLMRTAAQVYNGGSDTTSSALKTFVLAMTLHPDVQAKAQAEIDGHMANTGAGRLPNYAADHEDLYASLHTFIVIAASQTATEGNIYEGACLGKYLATDTLFTAIASLIAVFNIKKARDGNGNEITPKEEYGSKAIIAPLPFPCVAPRSKAAEQLVDDAVNALA